MQYQKPVLIQEQRLKLSPQMLQSIQMMALPITELKLKIAEELEKNPSLEIIKDASQISYEEMDRSTETKDYDYFETSSDPGYSSHYDDEASDAKQKFLEGAISKPESLHEHLLWQLRLVPLDEDALRIGEELILNLDQNGFHLVDPDTLFPPKQKKLADEMVQLIQRFDPAGICTANYRESLLVQIQLDPDAVPFAEILVRDHLEKMEHSTPEELGKDVNIDPKAVAKAIQYIKSLTPFPGRLYDSEPPHYVVPDVSVRLEEGEFKIYLNDSDIPELGVSKFYTDFSKDSATYNGGTDKEAKKFALESVRQAEWFINSLEQRNRSLLKITKSVVEFQRDFFLKGPKYLAPLTLKDIADEVSVHETTVSRISNAKYMQTEWGIFPIKYFFSNSISGAGSTGSRFSKGGVKEMIREILEQEEGSKSLSDQKISDLLKAKGVSIARRTVTKYRKELKIESSFHR